MTPKEVYIPVPVEGNNIPDGKIEFYGALHDYKKVDALFIPPILENYMFGFFNWLFKRLEKKEVFVLTKEELEKVFRAGAIHDDDNGDLPF